MKKFIVILSILLCLIDVPTLYAHSMWDTPRTQIQAHQLIFLRVRDEYQLRYAIGGLPQGTYQVRANFWSTTGTYYDTVFENPTGIAYLTCNGTYIFEVLDSSGQTISETTQIKTTKIAAPACKSYENGGLKNDFYANIRKNQDNSVVVEWKVPSDAGSYDFYKDGEYYSTSTADEVSIIEGGYAGIQFFQEGAYTIVQKDKAGNYMGSVDFLVGGADEGVNNGGGIGDGGDNGGGDGGDDGSGDNGGGCNGCDWIKDALACPAWDEYMGEWKKMLQEVYQPPNWQEVANIMRDTIVPAMGQELVNRSPEMARIFADEFTSREKKTQPAPTTPPTYTPPTELPQLKDMNEVIDFDLSNDIPSFEPDYSESQPFDIPNPFDLQLDDNDLGYNIQTAEPEQRDYNMPQIGGGDNDMPQYNAPSEGSDTIPQYNTPQDDAALNYNITPNDGVRYYEGGEGS